jgi:hypothetical protein
MKTLRTIVAGAMLASFTSETPAFAQSCTEQFSKCIVIGPTLGFGNAENAKLCNIKRMKCLHTGCWYINRQGTTRCGISKQ